MNRHNPTGLMAEAARLTQAIQVAATLNEGAPRWCLFSVALARAAILANVAPPG